MSTADEVQAIRGRIAEAQVKKQDIAALLGYAQPAFSMLINGRMEPPLDFAARVNSAIDRLQKAEIAARQARERFLAEAEETEQIRELAGNIP